MRFSLLCIISGVQCASSFISFQAAERVKPGLKELIDLQAGTELRINLNVGGDKQESRLGISGMILSLESESAPNNSVHLPGVNGPHPHLSSGAHTLGVIKEGGFVNMEGSQVVEAHNPCWELVWKEDAPAGSLVCGFETVKDYSRNDARLPQGRLYISFPVWTEDGLEYARGEKEVFHGYQRSKKESLDKFEEESNPIMKALHYREACIAAEKLSLYPKERFEIIPDDGETMKMHGSDYLIATRGLVWTKDTRSGQQILLGAADIRN